MEETKLAPAGKGWSVAGVFWTLIGAGVVLDTQADGIGLTIVACGLCLVGVGALRSNASGRRSDANIRPEETTGEYGTAKPKDRN